ncbi:MAG: ATP-binding cassette domain-containing protein, partial [Melioribacteraceae bacterium]|nr:ATP-binding cassette domain-containing protein [Melioribacteraceae bacterium]
MANIRLIKIEGLSKSFGDLQVLDNISVDVMTGENFIVFGRSGTGKSVLLKCIIGLLQPDKGEICINKKNIVGMPIKKLNKIRKRIGFLFQGSALYDSMSVRENLEFPLTRQFKYSKEELN